MRLLKRFPIAAFLLMTGVLVGCNQQGPRMKNQPANQTSGETKIELPGKKKSFDAVK
jgi:hypothetical protein